MRLLVTLKLLFVVFLSQISFAQTTTNTKDEIVYVTNTGTKYHAAGCMYLKNSSNKKLLSEVIGSYSPCSKCFGASSNQSTSPKQKVSSGSSNSVATPSGQTKSGATIYTGPRGGKYHYSKSGKKVYERKK